MSKTKIEWTEMSWNPVTGCSKVSEGCAHCYAERMARRLAGRYDYPDAPDHFRVTLHPDRLDEPLHWRKPRMIFVCSMGDLFHEDVPDEFIDRVITMCLVSGIQRGHTFQILTKRAERMYRYFAEMVPSDLRWPYKRIHLGVSCENQVRADERIPWLLRTPAAVRFVSAEPLLSVINFKSINSAHHAYDNVLDGTRWLDYGATVFMETRLDQIIVGAETGPGARPMDPAWARSIRDQCHDAGVAFFLKRDSHGLTTLDGREYHEYPAGVAL